MPKRLTDEQLIQLVQEKPPEELTAAEVGQLRDRLRDSPALQETLLSQLHLESYLNEALAEVNLSVDAILTQAAARAGFATWPLAYGLGGLLLAAGVAAYLLFAPRPDAPPKVAAVEAAEKTPAEEDEETEPKPAKPAPPKEVRDPTDAASPSDLDAQPPQPNPSKEQAVAMAATAPATKDENQDENQPPAGPWTAALAPDRPALSFREVALREPENMRIGYFPADELKKWLAPVPGKPHAIHAERRRDRDYCRLEGWAKLRAPWPDDGALRLALFDIEELQIHLWTGEEGVSLRFGSHQNPKMWAAYRAAREGAQPEPKRLALLTSDGGRHERSNLGRFALRWQDGALVMTRGTARLLTVPLAAPPREVFFEGRARFAHLSMVRSEPAPEPPAPSRETVLGAEPPARLAWFATDLEKNDATPRQLQPARASMSDWSRPLNDAATLAGLADGRARLTVGKTEAQTVAFARLPGPGLYEAIFCVEDAGPGTGIYLGDARGEPLHQIGFFRDRKTGWTSFGHLKYRERRVEVDLDPRQVPAPYAGDRQWLRLVVGVRTLKLWTSGDGRHWGQAWQKPVGAYGGPWSTLGVYCLPGETERSITLKHLEVRELSALASLASEQLRRQVRESERLDARNLTDWLARTMETCPADVALPAWRRARALETLAQAPPSALGRDVFDRLLQETLAAPPEDLDPFELLQEAALVGDLQGGNESQAYARLYREVGERAARRGRPRPVERVTEALLATPFWTTAPIEVAPPALAEGQLLRLAYRGDWEGVHRVARWRRAWNRPVNPDRRASYDRREENSLATWAETLAQHHAPTDDAGGAAAALADAWRRPLLTQISKEGYNVMAEFESAVEGRAWRDACQIIAAASDAGLLGLLPDSRDARLLVSLPRAIGLTMREHPALREAMEQQQGPRALLRARRAMSEGNLAAVEAATVQFYGTAAAAEAHAWLGDNHLAAGRFARAWEHYRRALEHAPPDLRSNLLARQRLAAAMLGQNEGTPPSAAVEIAGETFTPERFEQLVARLIEAHAPESDASKSEQADDKEKDKEAPRGAPPPTRFAAKIVGQWEGDVGRSPGRGEFKDIDWSGRQWGVAVAENGATMYVSNRFTINAYDAKSGKAKWSRRLGGEQGEAHHWPGAPMRPLLLGKRLYVRRLTKEGPELACLQTSDGKVLWQSREKLQVASDPVFAHGKLLALVATAPRPGALQIEVAQFDSETGEILVQEPLARLRDHWEGQPPCRLLAVEGKLLATVGGNTICSDLFGHPQWLRSDIWVPREVDDHWRRQFVAPPLVEGERVYVAQVGARNLVCLELATGREYWSRPVPKIERLLGLVEGRLIARIEGGLEAYDAQTGDWLWRHEAEDMLCAARVGDSGNLLYAERVEFDNNRAYPSLVWLDPRSGEVVARRVLEELEHKDPQFGPLARAGDQWWGFFGRGWQDPRRALVQLTAQEGLPPDRFVAPPLIGWLDGIDIKTQAHAAAALPGWTVTTPQNIRGKLEAAELAPEWRGEQNVLKMLARENDPARLARRVAVPPSGAKLRLRVGHDGGKAWRLRVAAGGQTLAEIEINDETAPDGWKTWEVDLSPLAGKTVWLTLAQRPPEKSQDAFGYWKRAEILLP